MISELINSPFYWISFFLLLYLFSKILKARLLDPNFLIALNFAQITAHLLYLYFVENVLLNLLIFNFFFVSSFILGWFLGSLVMVNSVRHANINVKVSYSSGYLKVLHIVSLFLVIKLVFLYLAFDINLMYTLRDIERISAYRELGIYRYILWISGALIAIILFNFNFLRFINLLVLFFLAFFSVSGGSKAGLLGFLLSFMAVKSWKGAKISVIKVLILTILVFTLPIFFIRERFPGLGYFEILYLLFYRIVANTDALENIHIANIDLKDYPYAGPMQLIDPIVKLLRRIGFEVEGFEYAPGLWLHGMAYGDWSGLGPNPSYIVEFYQANLFFTSYVIAFLLGILLYKITLYKGTNNVAYYLLWIIYPSIFRDTSFFWLTFTQVTVLIILSYIVYLIIIRYNGYNVGLIKAS